MNKKKKMVKFFVTHPDGRDVHRYSLPQGSYECALMKEAYNVLKYPSSFTVGSNELRKGEKKYIPLAGFKFWYH